MKLDILAIAAHCDDNEITCGGLLIKHRRMGYAIGAVDLTRGEMGTRGTSADRAREAREAGRVMDLAFRENLKLPDGGVMVTKQTIMKLARVIRRVKPRVVILPHWQGRHPDHSTCSELGWQACYFAGLRKYDLSLPPHRPFKVLFTMGYQQLVPSLVVDITDCLDQKLKAVMCYRSQFTDQKKGKGIFPPADQLLKRFRAHHRHYGSLIGVEYGEAYVMKEMAEISDVVTMSVRSM